LHILCDARSPFARHRLDFLFAVHDGEAARAEVRAVSAAGAKAWRLFLRTGRWSGA
jgi:hypothetical protein